MSLRKEASRDQARLLEVAWRVDDAENMARLNNIRFVGFPEGLERANCGEFLKK